MTDEEYKKEFSKHSLIYLQKLWDKLCNKKKFADKDLKDIDSCFAVIVELLQKRRVKRHLSNIIDEIKQIRFQ